MRVFLDFEASSLSDDSYPVEVGWVFEDGREEAHLIRPAADWTDWAADAEATHGLSRERLEREGEAHDRVARRMVEVLTGHDLFATAPSWDGKWLSVLLRSAGLDRRALRLLRSDEAHRAAAVALMTDREDAGLLLADRMIAEAREHVLPEEAEHRALADARAEWRVWQEVQRLALGLPRS